MVSKSALKRTISASMMVYHCTANSFLCDYGYTQKLPAKISVVPAIISDSFPGTTQQTLVGYSTEDFEDLN
jgi:hypothetical protein